jgi:protease IV
MFNVFLLAKAGADGGGTFGEQGQRRHAAVPSGFQYVQVVAAKDAATEDRIAQIDVSGIITGDELRFGSMVTDFKRQLDQAIEDTSIKAIVLRIDSPGGEVTASDTMYKAAKEAAAKKPIVVYMDTVAASGGYYIACGTETIVCHPTGITGSIGVIMGGYGFADLMAKVGVENRTFKSGAMKDAGSMSRAMTDDEKAYFQGLVMANYERFVGIVSGARKIPVEELKNGIADGRIFIGMEAKEKKLVDEIGYLEDAFSIAKTKAGLTDAEVVKFARKVPNFVEMLSLMSEAKTQSALSGKIEVDVADRLLPPLKRGLCYYLAPGWAE